MNTKHLEKIINGYKNWHKNNPDSWIAHCKSQESLQDAIETAARAVNHLGKKNPHQYRLRHEAIEAFVDNLLEHQTVIENTQNFTELLKTITNCKITYIGPLACYDTAIRIGAWLDLYPTHIYLHRGTRTGAEKLLGKRLTQSFIDIADLPQPFQASGLTNDELENLLCMCKDCFEDPTLPCPPLRKSRRRSGC